MTRGRGPEALRVLAAEVRRLQALQDARNAEAQAGSNPLGPRVTLPATGGIAPRDELR